MSINTKMIRVTKHIHTLETKPTYRMVNNKNEYFVYGEGLQKTTKTKTTEIPKFLYEGSSYDMNELITFAVNNKEYFFGYLNEYGFRVVADQNRIQSQDVASLKSWNFLKHVDSNPKLLDYLAEVRDLYDEFKGHIQIVKNLDLHTKYQIKELNFNMFCFYDWMYAQWQLYIIGGNLHQSTDTPFIAILNRYNLSKKLSNMSIGDTLNHLSNSDLGNRMEKVLTFHTFLEKHIT